MEPILGRCSVAPVTVEDVFINTMFIGHTACCNGDIHFSNISSITHTISYYTEHCDKGGKARDTDREKESDNGGGELTNTAIIWLCMLSIFTRRAKAFWAPTNIDNSNDRRAHSNTPLIIN